MRAWLLIFGFTISVSSSASGQQRPLPIDDPEILDVGRVRVEFGFEFLQRQRYPLAGLEGDLTRLGVAGIHVGVGRYAELQISGVIQDFLSVTKRTPAVIAPDFGGNATSDVGDLVLATKLKLVPEADARPAFSFKFAVQLPNASNESGLGTDVTNFYSSLLLSKNMGRARLLGNVGLAILGSPVQANSQSDLFTYGFGMVIPVHAGINLVGGIEGREGPHRVGAESLSQARIGVQIRSGGLRWDLAGIAGIKRYDPDTGFVFGVTFEFQAFERVKRPTTIP